MNSETTKGTRDQSLSDLLHSWKFSSWKFMKPRLNGGRRSTCASNSALLPSNAIDFAMLSAQRFWRETVSLLDFMWPRSNQWERALLGKSIQLYNNKNRPFAIRSHVTSFSMKMKVIWFCVQKTILKWFSFSNPHHFLKMSQFVAGHVSKMWFLKLWITVFIRISAQPRISAHLE